MKPIPKLKLQAHQFTLATCTVALLVLTACGGGSGDTPVNDVVMYKYLEYDPYERPELPKTYAEALSNGRDILSKRGAVVSKEVCGELKAPILGEGPLEMHTDGGPPTELQSSGVQHLITVTQTQVDSVQSLGYEKYGNKNMFDLLPCDLNK